jgi:hypothetical protein
MKMKKVKRLKKLGGCKILHLIVPEGEMELEFV